MPIEWKYLEKQERGRVAHTEPSGRIVEILRGRDGGQRATKKHEATQKRPTKKNNRTTTSETQIPIGISLATEINGRLKMHCYLSSCRHSQNCIDWCTQIGEIHPKRANHELLIRPHNWLECLMRSRADMFMFVLSLLFRVSGCGAIGGFSVYFPVGCRNKFHVILIRIDVMLCYTHTPKKPPRNYY